jgi:hypothetical protein
MRALSSGSINVDRILVLTDSPEQESYDKEVEEQEQEFHMLVDGAA